MIHAARDPLPDFQDAGELLRRSIQAIRPPARVTVSQCAERHRRLNNPGSYVGPWRNDLAPYLVEPMDRTASRAVELEVVIGPAQFGKTEIHLNVIGHAAKYRPANILCIQPTRELAADFSTRRLERQLFTTSPDFRACLAPVRSADQLFEKSFRSGAMISIAWPSPAQLASRPVAVVLVDERDRMPDDIGGEGDPISLARNRIKTFGKNGLVLVTSSPSRTDGTGVAALFDQGDARLWAWPCAECDEFWTPGFDADRRPTLEHLHYDAGEADQARKSARLVCPSCGSLLEESAKDTMNARGTWLARGQTINAAGEIHGAAPATRIASYWFSGLASNFVTWGDIAARLVAAEEHYRRTGEETELKAAYNTDLGIPYTPRHEGAAPLELDELAARRDMRLKLGTVPNGVKFLTAAVDVQGDRFEVLVKGWSADSESYLVDRFAIRQLADQATDVAPASYPEHWRELVGRVIERVYPLAEDPGRGLPIAKTAIDTGGLPGVTEHAYSFYRSATTSIERDGFGIAPAQIMLVKGANTRDAPSLPKQPTREGAAGKRAKWRAVPLYMVGVNRLKDALDNRLRRVDPGPGYIHFPGDTPDRVFQELTGEQKIDGDWIRKGPNETFDLDCYATAAALLLRPHRINWTAPPWFGHPRTLGAEGGGTESDEAPPRAPSFPAPASSPGPAPATAAPRRTRRRGNSYIEGWRK